MERCTKIQGFAAEGSGLPPEATQSKHVRHISFEELAKRYMEFTRWVAQYPHIQAKDVKSVYWN